MFFVKEIERAVVDAVAGAYGVDEETLTMQPSYQDDLATKSLKVVAMIMMTNENLGLEDDDEVEFEDVMNCQTLQDTVDVLVAKYGAE